jgi:hypothetical protein
MRGAVRALPKGLSLGATFSLPHDKLLLIDKSFSPEKCEAIKAVFEENAPRLSLINPRFVCVIPKGTSMNLFKGKYDDFEVIIIPPAGDVDSVRAEMYKALLYLGSRESVRPSIHLKISSLDSQWLESNWSEITSKVFKTIDPVGFILKKMRSAFGDFSEAEVEEAIRAIPEDLLKLAPPETLKRMVNMYLDHKRTGKDCVHVERYNIQGYPSSKNLVEICIFKNDYFGLSHDIVSILTVLGLSPYEIKFFKTEEETTKILCRAIASFTNTISGKSKLEHDIGVKLSKDEAKRAMLAAPGEKLWFSFVGVFNSIARFLRSVDSEAYPVEGTISILKYHHEVMRPLLEILRSKHDPSCRDEYPLKSQEKARYNEIYEKIRAIESAGNKKDSDILYFALNFVRSIKKTDYFDYNRMRQMFSMMLDFSLLRPFLKDIDAAYPGHIMYVYRRHAPNEILPIYSIEKTVEATFYSETGDIVGIPDPSISTSLILKGLTHSAQMRKIAENVLFDLKVLKPREFELFEGMDFLRGDEKSKIDKESPLSYFSMVAGALFRPVFEDGLPHNEGIYLYDIASMLGMKPDQIQSIHVKFLGEGGLKNVSFVQLFGSSFTRSFIVGVNRRDVSEKAEGHCLSEHKVLVENLGRTPLLPRPLGFSKIKSGGDEFGVIYKEYLIGEDALAYFAGLKNEGPIAELFHSVGLAVGRLFSETGQGSSDFKLSNMIFHQGRIRFCDISPMTDDLWEVMNGFKQLINEVPDQYLFRFFDAVIEGGETAGAEFLGRIRNNLRYDQDDAWVSKTLVEQMDKFASSKGADPEEFFAYKL